MDSLENMKKIVNIILMVFVCLSTAGCDFNKTKGSNDFVKFNNRFNESQESLAKFDFNNTSAYESDGEKVVEIKRSKIGRSDPFLPMDAPSSIKAGAVSLSLGENVQELPLPTESINSSSSKQSVQLKVNGILYDSKNSSSILNFDGDDYVVHQGDKIFNFIVKAITSDKVIIAYGHNIYKKGIGESITSDSNSSPIEGYSNMYAGNSQSLPDIRFVSPKGYL